MSLRYQACPVCGQYHETSACAMKGHQAPAPSPASDGEVAGWSGAGGHVGWCNTCDGRGKVGTHPADAARCVTCNGTGSYRFPPCNVAMNELREKHGHLFDGVERPSDTSLPSARGVVSEEMSALASHWERTAEDLYAASEKEKDQEAAKTQRVMKAVYRQLASDLRAALSQGGGGEDGWIPCSERMPELYANAWLDFGPKQFAAHGFLSENGKWMVYGEDGLTEVEAPIRWLPLPAPANRHDEKGGGG